LLKTIIIAIYLVNSTFDSHYADAGKFFKGTKIIPLVSLMRIKKIYKHKLIKDQKVLLESFSRKEEVHEEKSSLIDNTFPYLPSNRSTLPPERMHGGLKGEMRDSRKQLTPFVRNRAESEQDSRVNAVRRQCYTQQLMKVPQANC
jgi:hypothetical protein